MHAPVADIVRKLGITERPFYRWKQQYSGLEPGQAREPRQLREANAKLKKLVANQHKVALEFSRPGKPTDNAYIESFNGSLRDECLNVHWFSALEDAKAKIEAWRQEYNESRRRGCFPCRARIRPITCIPS
jgi:transposase InsO family protein